MKLIHFRLCPLSRSIRLALGEREDSIELAEERAWEWRGGFLALNPAGELPVLEIEPGIALCGVYAVSEYLGETEPDTTQMRRRTALFPGLPEDRAEVRRIVDWFHRKFDREVSRELLAERVYPVMARATSATALPAAPNVQRLRALRANLKHHLGYLDFLTDQRHWLAGEAFSFADLAAAAHVSLADYLGEIPWGEHGAAKNWYARIKSRPAFRALLADRIPGLAPPAHYADLDF